MMHTPDRSALLRRIQAEDFALYEVALYLDGHPDCKKALRYYKEHKKLAAELKEAYEEQYGPLTVGGNRNEQHWDWVSGPWPWEKEAN